MALCTEFTDLADLTLFYPALIAAVDAAIVTIKLDCLECKFDFDKWGCNLLEGSRALVAHHLKMALAASQSVAPVAIGGVVTGMSQGPVSASFSAPAADGSDAWLSKTNEGQLYMSLRETVSAACTVRVRGGGRCVRIAY